MNVVIKKVSDLHFAEKNVRKHPQKQIEELQRSYNMFGQYRPLVVSCDGEVLVGNGFLEAVSQAGVEEVECIVLPENVSDDYKKKLMLADNKIFDLGTDAMANIDDILKEMSDFNIPGFDESILSQLYNEVEEGVKSIEATSVNGVVPPDVIERVNKVHDSRVENPPTDDLKKYEVKQEVVQMRNEHEGEPYITCPHCGVKIYGYS